MGTRVQLRREVAHRIALQFIRAATMRSGLPRFRHRNERLFIKNFNDLPETSGDPSVA